jgi:phytoene synthase
VEGSRVSASQAKLTAAFETDCAYPGYEARNRRRDGHWTSGVARRRGILRDLDEDAARGRLYLPREALRDAGIEASDSKWVLAHPGVGNACPAVAGRALGHFAEADKVLSKYPRRIAVAPLLIAKAYRHILDGLIDRGWSAPRSRMTIGLLSLLRIVAPHTLRPDLLLRFLLRS